MSHSMGIRPFSDADVEPMATVKLACWKQFFKEIIPPQRLDSMTLAEVCGRLRTELSACSGTFVVDNAACVAGYVMFGASRDRGEGAGATGEIIQLYVAPAFVRKGWGRRLAAEALERLQNAGCVAATIWTFDENDIAKKFYGSLGFRPDGASKTVTIGGLDIKVVRYRKHLECG